MKAAVYFGAGNIRATDVADPKLIEDHSVLVEVSATSICGSDLNIYSGSLDAIMEKGHSQTGHELIGIIKETGAAVQGFKNGDRISMAYSCSCGRCHMCYLGQTAHCETTQKSIYGFGTAFGNLNGTHSEALVIPYADGHVVRVPDTISDSAGLTLSCNLPAAIVANKLVNIQPGESVAVIGCGPTGLMCLDIVLSKKATTVVAIDIIPHRLEVARKKGVVALNSNSGDWQSIAMGLVNNRGFDKVIEVCGSVQSLQIALDIIRPGGVIAAMGVFCEDKFNLNLADVFLRNISLHMNGFASVQSFMLQAMNLIEQRIVVPEDYFSHEFKLENIDQAYEKFFNKSDNAMKMLIRP